ADLVPPNYLRRNKNHTPVTGIDQGLTLEKRVYPIRPTPAVNRGYIPGILDEEKKLREFTAACSPFVFRGSALPEEFYGNVFVCEPSGNLIKRNVLKKDGLHLHASDPHPGREFLASTDERFRPVHLAQGPDGALYLVDMYRGLIQHKAYLTPYLRDQTQSRKLMLPINRGRIWRIVPDDWKPSRQVKLSQLTSLQLVDHLSNADGWYRDMAQRLLVERNDQNLFHPLANVALKGKNRLGRFHALWTLEGLNQLESELLFSLIDDTDLLIRTTALRLLEPIALQNRNLLPRLERTLSDDWQNAPIGHVMQIAFTAGVLNTSVAHDLLQGIATKYDTSALIRDAILSSIGGEELPFMKKLLASPDWREQKPSREIFLEMITSAVVRKHDPAEVKTLLGMLDVSRERFGWKEKAILTGMSIQGYSGKVEPLKLATEPRFLKRADLSVPPSQMQGLAALFEWPGSVLRDTTQQVNVLTEKEKEQFALGRKFYLSSCSGCHGNDGGGLNRFAPPLKGSEWVVGDEKRLALIVLHGIEGPLEVAGKRYAEPEILPVMPGHSILDDGTLSAILTYIRNEWGNQAPAIDRRELSRIRVTNQGRILPWTAEELETHLKGED
ncbi:MAG TPA: c-type cytochrome, partial [Chryseosolibacter sp.]